MSGTLAESEITVLFSELPQAHWFDMICRPIECDSLLIMQPQCRVQWSQVESSRAASTCRPWGKEEEGRGGDKPIDRCNRSVWQLFSYLVCSICVKSLSMFFLILFAIIIIIFMQFGIFFLVSVFLFFLTDLWSDVATVGGGRSSGKWMAPTTFNVFDGFISQMPTDTGRIDSYPNCIRTWSTSSNKLNSRFDWMNTRIHMQRYFFSTDSLAIVVLMKLFSGHFLAKKKNKKPAGDFWPLITDICSEALVFIILIIFYWYAICKDLKQKKKFKVSKLKSSAQQTT